MNQRQKQICIIGAALVGGLLFTLFFGINLILRGYTNHVLRKVAKLHQLDIRYQDVRMDGLTTLCMDGLTVIPIGADTLFSANHLQAKVGLGQLLLLDISVESVSAEHISLHFIKEETTSNFGFLYPSPKQGNRPDDKDKDYAQKMKRSLNLLFKLLPENASIRDLCVSYSNNTDKLILQVNNLNIKDNQFITHLISTENEKRSEWGCEGSLSDKERLLKVRLYAHEHTKIPLPFLEYRWGMSVRFDTLSFELRHPKTSEDIQSIQGNADISGLTVHHRRISPDTVLLDKWRSDYLIHVGKDYLELDSTTEVRFNTLDFHPYLQMRKDTAWHIIASIDKKDFPANHLFSSLPKGLFYNLEGLKTQGTLSFHFLLDLDFEQIDSLIFESVLKARDFHVLSYGNTELTKINGPFTYTAYEQGEVVRSFEIGAGNPSFRPYHAISHYLPLSIMQSEDPGFFLHAGFIPSAIRESLILDIKERRFARGGSTLSMQLVKNVFLNRNKTIARKLEEILIVWLIENNRLTSKERIFEVYMNIIEWGPMVYGVTEAAQYYFAKEPSQLSLAECIFLASIIPKPKHMRYCFDGLALKSHYKEFFHIIVGRLVDRGLITPEEAIGVTPESVQIIGPAKHYLTNPSNRELLELDADTSSDTQVRIDLDLSSVSMQDAE